MRFGFSYFHSPWSELSPAWRQQATALVQGLLRVKPDFKPQTMVFVAYAPGRTAAVADHPTRVAGQRPDPRHSDKPGTLLGLVAVWTPDEHDLFGHFSSTSLAHYDLQTAVVYNVCTHPSARRRGIASRLLSQAEQWCRTHRRPAVRLYVDRTNRAAQALYSQAGYAPVSWLGETPAAPILMGKTLS